MKNVNRAGSGICELKNKLFGSPSLHLSVVIAARLALELQLRRVCEGQRQQSNGHPGKECHLPDNIQETRARRQNQKGRLEDRGWEPIFESGRHAVCYSAPDFQS